MKAWRKCAAIVLALLTLRTLILLIFEEKTAIEGGNVDVTVLPRRYENESIEGNNVDDVTVLPPETNKTRNTTVEGNAAMEGNNATVLPPKTNKIRNTTTTEKNETYLLSAWRGMPPARQKNNNDTQHGLIPTKHRFIRNWKAAATVVNRSNPFDVVLTTHISANRFDVIETCIGFWGGPVSLAAYITSEEDIGALEDFVRRKSDFLANTSIHVLLEEKTPPGLEYPHNLLRNLAMDEAPSDYFVALDADFIPSPNSHGLIESMLRDKAFRERLHNRQLFVLPAFEVFPRKGEARATVDMLPRSKAELFNKTKTRAAGGFHLKLFPPGHKATNFPKWFSTTIDKNGTEIEKSHRSLDSFYYSISYEEGYEPYVLAYRPRIPRFWPHFRGFGHNKLSWLQELDRAGYSYSVLVDCFVTHLNHPYNRKRELTPHTKIQLSNFKKYLNQRYKD